MRSLIIIFLVIVSCSGRARKELSEGSYNEPILDTLFSANFDVKTSFVDIHNVFDSIFVVDNPKKFDALRRYSIESELACYGIATLIRLGDTSAVSVLQQSRSKIGEGGWKWICEALEKNPYKLENFQEVMIEVMLTTPYKNARMTLASYLSRNSLSSNVLKIWDLNEQEVTTSSDINWLSFAVLPLYKTSETDSIIKNILSEPLKNYKGTFTLVQSTYWNVSRYDLIQELVKLKLNIQNEKHPIHIEVAKEIITEIDKAIPKLQEAKKKELPLAKPIDWGMDK